MSDDPIISSVLATAQAIKRKAEAAAEQLTDQQLHQALDPETNCVAVIIKHMAGNMCSRWTDFLTSDGHKPWRDRDAEFVDDISSRSQLLTMWERGWTCFIGTLSALSSHDLSRTVHMRGQPQSAIAAIHEQLYHYGYHVGQIVLIARILAQDKWTCLSIPRRRPQQTSARPAIER
jgi:hypothetical protein